jgi:adenylylsulfate kinase
VNHRIVWLYGLAGSGKSTIAHELGRVYGATVVDSDVFRHAWPNLGWSENAKKERATRLLSVALTQERAVVACITPYAESRKIARHNGALLVHVDTSPEECARRKPELYERAEGLAGKDAPFEQGPCDIASWNADDIAVKAGWR